MPPLPPIYCITLAEEPWKRVELERHFADLSLNVNFLHGFYGITLGLKPTNPYEYDEYGHPKYIHASQVGCLLSHLMALQVALSTEAPDFIILEDDVELITDFTPRFTHLLSTKPESINLINLELFDADLTNKPHEKVNDTLTRIHYPFGSAALWWRRDAAQLAVKTLRPISHPSDIAFIHRVYPFVDVAVANPPLIRQRSRNGSWPSTVDSGPKQDNTQLGG